MKVLQSTCLIFTGLLLWSCQKEPEDKGPYPTVIEGYMTERGTGNPIEGIQIDLFGPAAPGPREVLTDAEGFYRFDLGMQEDSRKFYVDFYGNNRYYHWKDRHYAQNQGYNRIDGEISAVGWLKLHLKNVNYWNRDDNISFLHGYNHSYYGLVDKEILLDIPANQERIFEYQVTRKGETAFLQDTLYPIGHDTVSHAIFY